MLLWDDNQISIEDDTRVAFSEDVRARYEAYGWHVQTVDWVGGSRREGPYHEDVESLYAALHAARAETERPSFIALRTIIGWPAPTKQNTGTAHGSALGADEVAATKKLLGFDPEQTFTVADDVREHALAVRDRGAALHRGLGPEVRCLASGQPGSGRAARPAVELVAADRLGRCTANVPARQGRRHPESVR